MLLTDAVRTKYMEELQKEFGLKRYPSLGFAAVTNTDGSYQVVTDAHQATSRNTPEHIKYLETGFSYIKKLAFCCGVVDIGNWYLSEKVEPAYARNFKVFIDLLQRGAFGLQAGSVITTTNSRFTEVNALLKKCGFEGKTFYNQSSGGNMTLWTLVLHPKG